eukprot:c10032_g1_i8.p1 GENE.c10032_g1_i8~~c10032_g1_i8.p1  ORF type:complete len:212 (-),score=31.35 c10032_g1_i8:342-929(-)
MTSSFSETFEQSRTKFRTAAAENGAMMFSESITGSGAHGEALSIDFAVWRKSDETKRAFVMTSGVHGVEGFAGCAIFIDLCSFAKEYFLKLKEGDVLVIIHSVNPYGMSWYRRFSENNVDLNRNCMLPAELAEMLVNPTTEIYTKHYEVLNPPVPVPEMQFDFFLFQSLGLLLRYGFEGMKQATVSGQYLYPEGL